MYIHTFSISSLDINFLRVHVAFVAGGFLYCFSVEPQVQATRECTSLSPSSPHTFASFMHNGCSGKMFVCTTIATPAVISRGVVELLGSNIKKRK